MVPGPDQANLGRFVGQLKEFFEFQKIRGRQFFPKSEKNQDASILRADTHGPVRVLRGLIPGHC